MNKIILNHEFKDYWSSKDVFNEVLSIKGEVAKAKDNRRVIRFTLEKTSFDMPDSQNQGSENHDPENHSPESQNPKNQ